MSWREIQKTNFHSLDKLAQFLDVKLISPNTFPLNLPRRLANKMPKKTLDDPITRQFVPSLEESKTGLDFVLDPVEDARFCKSEKLLQKYQGRALILTTSACAMHCRYCFRMHFDYAKKSDYKEELDLIANDSTLFEVILSGGDPLSLSDQDLEKLLTQLDQIDHIKLIRFHTRFPIGIPERIDPSFLQLLEKIDTQIVFVIHANHSKELDSDVLSALKKIQVLGIPILHQAVLLKGVNDNLSTLKALFETCVQHGIIPYYLHQLDKVEGASHFEVSIETGKQLIKELRSQLPGYAVPKYVQEVAGLSEKTIIF